MENTFTKTTLRERFQPMLEKWEFNWPKEQSLEIMKQMLIDFNKKLYLGKENLLEVSAIGEMSIRGMVYGHKKFKDGEDIFTSNVVKIERVDWKPDSSTWFSGKYPLEEVAAFAEKEIFCATTESGSKYYFIGDNPSSNMFLYLAKVNRIA